jgi:ketosteroid isomerase-like protein
MARQFGGDPAGAMSKETLATLRRGYDTINRGDTSLLAGLARELATLDVEWGAIGAFPGIEGMYQGPEAIQEWMEVIRSTRASSRSRSTRSSTTVDEVPDVAELLRGHGRGSGSRSRCGSSTVYWFEDGRQRIVVVSIIGAHRFADGYEWAPKGDVSYVPKMRTQLVAARSVAHELADPATDSAPAPGNGSAIEVAGPRPVRERRPAAQSRGHPRRPDLRGVGRLDRLRQEPTVEAMGATGLEPVTSLLRT